MGNVRIVTGRSGCGKTSYCINAFVQALSENRRADGSADAYLIVPEQFAVDYERKVLGHPECRGLLGGEVLSFRRFAHRILTEEAVRVPEMLSPSGKAMLLVRAVSECAPELQYYKRCAENAKSIAGLLDTVNEFSKYCVTPEMLEKAAALSESNDVLRVRLHELAVIYSKYSTLFSEDYGDTVMVYRKAAERIRSGAPSAAGAVVWIDSFSGFTESEILLLKAIADGCKELNICLFSDSEENLIFHCPNKTYHDILRIMRSGGHSVTITDLQRKSSDPETRYASTRFSGCGAIGFLEENFGRMHGTEEKADASGIEISRCTEPYREIENCAREIKRLADAGMAYRDIAVVDAKIDENAALFSAVFTRMKIPFFIDAKRDLSGHPVVRFILSFLDIITENMSMHSVFSMLKTGLYKSDLYTADCVDLLENTAIASGVSSARGWLRMCRRLETRFGEEMPDHGRLAFDLYACIYGENGFSEQMKKCASVNDCCRVLVRFAESVGLQTSIGHTVSFYAEEKYGDLPEIYARIWNIFTEIVRQASVFLGNVKVRGYKKLLAFFADALRAGFASCKIGFIPHTAQCVQIGNADRSRYLDKKAVFVTGANEGAFPSRFSEGGVLGDAERELLQSCGASLAYNSLEQTYFAQYNVYSVLTSPSERLYISYSAYGPDGSVRFPSSCISSLVRMFSGLEVHEADSSEADAPQDPLSQLPDPLPPSAADVVIDKKLAAQLLKIGAECRMSVSRLEEYRACPYSFFLRQCLKLKDRESGDIQNKNIGTYFHGLIEYSLKNRAFHPGEMETADADRIVRAASDAFFAEEDSAALWDLFENSAKSTMLRERIEEFAVQDVKNIAKLAGESGFFPIGEECRFGDESGAGLPPVKVPCTDAVLSLRGIIDRIDLRVQDGEGQLCIVDYKSSAQKFNEKTVEEGVKLQLFTYFLVLENLVRISEEKKIPLSEVFPGLPGDVKRNFPEKSSPAAVLYYIFGKNVEKEGLHTYSGFAKPGIFPNEKGGAYSVTETDMTSLSETAAENIRKNFDNISSGQFPVAPEKRKDPCRYCGCKSICHFRSETQDPDLIM